VNALIYLEHRGGAIVTPALGVLSKAAALGGEVAAVVVGPGAAGLAGEAGAHGASVVFVADDPGLEAPLPQPRVDVLAKLVRDEGFDAVLFAQSVLAADVAAGLAVRLEAGLNWDLTDVELRDGSLVGTRPALGDSVVAEVGWVGTPALAVFRSGSFDPVATGGTAEVREIEVELDEHSTRVELVGEAAAEEVAGPSIEEADVIVAGGRGLGAAEGFALVEELAGALGGAVAATRAVVDAGWYPYSTQVGQTGKTVSPKLYVAVGVSGAIQHKVGMQSAGTIVAINRDPHAPIFDYADLCVVGDLNEVVPRLTELVRQRRG
jgi:electron transfer flavoprotein alpha subunit